ncbi:MAG: YndJ family transporter, partial [Gammaproteobacteria bacterium]|nr:YndJ family transporter [Gammaproteobacteria bacterium]
TLVKNKTTKQRVPWERLPVAGGWLLLSIGGLWFTSLIVGNSPSGYDLRFTMLTALHFHFAGFALPVLTGQLIHFSKKNKLVVTNAPIVTCPILLLSIPSVGLGIAYSPTLEVVASISLLTCCILMAFCQIYCAGFIKSQSGWLLSISATALIVSSIMAIIYSIGEYTGNQSLAIPVMIVSHGVLNSLGFSLLGLIGWTMNKKTSK